MLLLLLLLMLLPSPRRSRLPAECRRACLPMARRLHYDDAGFAYAEEMITRMHKMRVAKMMPAVLGEVEAEMAAKLKLVLREDGEKSSSSSGPHHSPTRTVTAAARELAESRFGTLLRQTLNVATVEEWADLSTADIPDALNRLAWKMGGTDDLHASARYRRELVRRIGQKLIEETLS